jgi:hypothetical protein
MKTKDQLNQNPDVKDVENQEENSVSEEKTEKKSPKTKSVSKGRKKTVNEPSLISDPGNITELSVTADPDQTTEPAAIIADPVAEAAQINVTLPEAIQSTDITEFSVPETVSEITAVQMNDDPGKDQSEIITTQSLNEHEIFDNGEALGEEDEDDDEIHADEQETEQQLQEENLSRMGRNELVELLEETVKDSDLNAIKKKIALIKVAFLKINKEEQQQKYENLRAQGGDKTDYSPDSDNLESRFEQAFNVYKEKRQLYLDEQEKIKQQNLEAKKIILEELKALIDSEESLKKTYDEFKVLQDKWKELGMVPKAEVSNLWQSYHFLVEKFFDKVKINKELRDLDLKKNLESKIELCEKTESLLLETSVLKSFKKLQQYHQQWKEIGPIPQDKKEELWDRFKNATDKINQLRRDHYLKIQDDQKNNFTAKITLCEKAEEVLQKENTSIKDWQDNTDQITELLKVWKSIGPAPRQQNDEIWERFRNSLDAFFSAKKEYFQGIKDEQLNNYNLKLELCVQAEAIKSSTDWRKTTQELINLQKEWKNIGPVPRKHADKIWKRFRAACDEFFNSKSEFFANIDKNEQENLKLKQELIKKVEAYEFSDNKNGNLDVLQGFQREWTEIGHVPMNQKEKLQNDFRNAINKQLDKLNITKAQMQTLNYRHRIEGLKDGPNARKIINNERTLLITKRKKLEDELMLLENNIGFLAKSKNASLLREEFEKKISDSKKEIQVMNEKIKFLERETE